MRRGQFVVVATPGDYGKPRPALVVQSDIFSDLPSVVVCPVTSTIRTDADEFGVDVAPTNENGLRNASQISVDKIVSIPIGKVGGVIGTADEALLLQVTRVLAVFLSIV